MQLAWGGAYMHVTSLFCQHVAPQLPQGRSWDAYRDVVADAMIATVERYAPGFAASVLGRQVLTPLDLEHAFGLVGGDIFHGALSLNHVVQCAADAWPGRDRGAIASVFLCGSGTHPWRGAPGHNAAMALLRG